MELSGGSLRNENIKNSQELLKATFTDDATLFLGIYMWEHGISDYSERETIDIRLFNETFSNANGITVQFQTLFNTPIIVGDMIYDSKADRFLICTEAHNIGNVHWQGKFTQCNWILKWQDKSGKILNYPCVDTNTTQYNSGEQTSKNAQFRIGSSQHTLLLPYDENTVILSSPQRFFLDRNTIKPTSFIVTQNDTTSYGYGNKGLIKVTVLECEVNNETDRIDLGICDYKDIAEIKKDNIADNNLVNKSVITYDTNVIKSGGDMQTFVGKFYDNFGNEITYDSIKWNIVCDFRDCLNIKEADNQISIGIDNDNYIDEEFKLILSDDNGDYTSDLIVRIESLL